MAYTKLSGVQLMREVVRVRDEAELSKLLSPMTPHPYVQPREGVDLFARSPEGLRPHPAVAQLLKRGARRTERYEGRAACRDWREAA